MTLTATMPTEGAAMTLEREMKAFRRELPLLLQDPQNRGKYAVIHHDQVAGVEPTLDAALRRGYQLFNLDPFMVKKVEEEEPVYFTRDVVACPS